MFIYENDKDVFMKNEKGLLLCLGAAALPPAGIAAYAHRLLKKRPLELLYQQRASESDFIPLSEIPDRMVQFILEAEDSDFYKHHGLNTEGIRDAIVINLNEKRVVSGGSTITQQLVKNLYFRFTKNYIRKATELLIVLQAEKRLGKDRILELYLNIIYYGNGVYGISDAAGFYFGKELRDLSVNQMFMLAVMPYAPTKGNPIQHPDVFERIRDRRLVRFAPDAKALLNEEETALISSYHADMLDPDLRKPDEWTMNYPADIVLVNERFGPYDIPSYRNPMER